MGFILIDKEEVFEMLDAFGDMDQSLEVRTYKRDFPPAHFMFKIDSFSLLSEAGMERYETGDFEVGGHKWSLAFYPNGNEDAHADGHISLYLAIKETENLPACWNVNASFKFFVFDHIRDNYLTIEGVDGSLKRFHAIKTEWGFSQLLSLESLKNASTGYLVGDSCVFGAEVYIVKSSFKLERLCTIKDTCNNVMTWNIEDFSKSNEEYCFSEVLDFEESKWKFKLFPNGRGISKGKSLSLYLMLVEIGNLVPSLKLFVQFKLRVRNLIQDYAHAERTCSGWLSSGRGFGFGNLISLQDLKNPAKGYMKVDCLTVEAEILHMSKPKA